MGRGRGSGPVRDMAGGRRRLLLLPLPLPGLLRLLPALLPLLPAAAFNLDLTFPVLKEGATPGGFFGFSVALHQQTEQRERSL